MPRIAGVDVPGRKPILYGLCYIYGVGLTTAKKILAEAKIEETVRSETLTEAQAAQIREIIEANYQVEGDLRRDIAGNIKRLKDLGTYKGLRHIRNLPVHGQRTHTNARTRKGKQRIAIAGKKQAPGPK
ncbi:MAG: 30S ribosomal protein S13 [Deltaproteobacteria bacterium]|nr:30S ribosomal protein S13 [Deltaproteobacteria bacterium]